MGEPEDKGYTVKGRRYLHLSEAEKGKIRAEEAAKEAAKDAAAEEAFQEASQKAAAEVAEATQEMPLPEITFSSFVFSLSSSALVSLGAIPDPNTGKMEKNLSMAKQTIDLLAILRDKTRNNLTQEEEILFDHLLYDLRMVYIKEVG
ncbi:MAG: DUF1844 domain-containing protein [Desulfobaccales bacterium]